MGTHYARHISRLTSVNIQSTRNMDFMKQVNFDPTFTHKHILKIQMMVDAECDVLINGHSRLTINPNYGLLLDYTDIIITSMIIETDGVNIYAIIGY